MFMKVSAAKKAADMTAGRHEYATRWTFCQTFIRNMNRLYLLALLLTADPRKAERCFVAGLEDCMSGISVFEKWAERWSRRMIITNAIQIVFSPTAIPKTAQLQTEITPNLCDHLNGITRLEPFERFVLVLSFFERYTDQECSILLNSTRGDIIRTRTRAVEKLAGFIPSECTTKTPVLNH